VQVGVREVIEAYLKREWRRATRLSLLYELPDLPERAAVVLLTDHDRSKAILSSWGAARTWFYVRWPDDTEERVALLTALDLERVRRLLEKGVASVAVYAGPETGGTLVKVSVGGDHEPLEAFTREALPAAYARARGRGGFKAFYRPAQSFMQVLMEQSLRKDLGAERKR
jgi:hypothetical protein